MSVLTGPEIKYAGLLGKIIIIPTLKGLNKPGNQ
jgi:hypothetical protein